MILWVLLLFVSGMILVFAEFFLPGLVLGSIGGIMIVISIGLGVHAYPDYALFIIIGELIGVGLCVVLGFWSIKNTAFGRLLMLEHAQDADAGYVSAASDMALLGQAGIVLTALRPSGTIRVADKRIDAVSDGVFIEEKQKVRVVGVHGSRVVVEILENGQQQ